MSAVTKHERPGVYSAYEASSLTAAAAGGGSVAVVAAVDGDGLEPYYQWTSYSKAAADVGECALSRMAQAAIRNGAGVVYGIPAGENYDAAFAVMAALEGWRGGCCVESFHPAALLRLKERYPQVLRGQLSQNFLKPGEANGLSLPVRFMLTNLLTTAATRPDFIAYSCKDRDNASLRLMRALYGVHEVGWTVRDRETMEALDREGAASIFEGFVP